MYNVKILGCTFMRILLRYFLVKRRIIRTLSAIRRFFTECSIYRNSGCAKLRKLQRIGQESYPFCKNKNLQIWINGCIIKLKRVISNL